MGLHFYRYHKAIPNVPVKIRSLKAVKSSCIIFKRRIFKYHNFYFKLKINFQLFYKPICHNSKIKNNFWQDCGYRNLKFVSNKWSINDKYSTGVLHYIKGRLKSKKWKKSIFYDEIMFRNIFRTAKHNLLTYI